MHGLESFYGEERKGDVAFGLGTKGPSSFPDIFDHGLNVTILDL